MFQLSIAGRLGRDAEYKQTQSGQDFCSFAVACDVGFGDRKTTHWVDVTRWGKGAQGLAGILRKGSSVAVTGELATREHNGKTYLQLRADNVTILGSKPEGGARVQDPQPAADQGGYGDLDTEIPF